MNCPVCHKPMVRGSAELGQTLAGHLVAGLSLAHLFFRSDDRDKVSVLDWKTEQVAADRCPACGVVVLQGNPDA